jgi:hypothetical protein
MILDSQQMRLNGYRMPTGKSAPQNPELQLNEAMLIEATNPPAGSAKVAENGL